MVAVLNLSASALATLKRFGFNYTYIVNRATGKPAEQSKHDASKKTVHGFLCENCAYGVHDCMRVKCKCPDPKCV